MAVTINEGTQTDIYTVVNAGTEITVVKLDVGSGTAISDFGGTIIRVNTIGTLGLGSVILNASTNNIGDVDVVTGTVTRVSNVGTVELGSVVVTSMPSGGTISTNQLTGTITTGTLQNLNFGTVATSAVPVTIGTSYGTLGTTGAAVWGTLIAAAGAGTRQYISGLQVVVASGTVDVAVTNIGVGGSTGAGVLARGQFTPGGGIQRTFWPVATSGANGTLSFWMGGAGTVAVVIDYWQGV